MTPPENVDTPAAWSERAGELTELIPAGFRVGITASPPAFDPLSDPVTDPVGSDLDLLADLRVDTCSIALDWARLQPDARGPLQRESVSYLARVLDGMIDLGISPTVSLVGPGFPVGGAAGGAGPRFGTGLPEALAGGWLNRDTTARFAEFAYLCADAFGGTVGSWCTVTDPGAIVWDGYALGIRPPYRRMLFNSLRAAHHLLLAHGLAVGALRDVGVAGRVGLTALVAGVEPATESDRDAEFAAVVDMLHNRSLLDPLLLGRLPDLAELPDEMVPFFSVFDDIDPADLSVMAAPLDWLGVDHRAPFRIGAGAAPAPLGDPEQSRFPFHGSGRPELRRGADGRPQSPADLAAVLLGLGARYGTALPPLTVSAGALSTADEIGEHLAAVLGVAGAGADADVGAGAGVDADVDVDAGAGAQVDVVTVDPGVRVEGFDLGELLDGDPRLGALATPTGLAGIDRRTRLRVKKPAFAWVREVLGAR